MVTCTGAMLCPRPQFPACTDNPTICPWSREFAAMSDQDAAELARRLVVGHAPMISQPQNP